MVSAPPSSEFFSLLGRAGLANVDSITRFLLPILQIFNLFGRNLELIYIGPPGQYKSQSPNPQNLQPLRQIWGGKIRVNKVPLGQ